ncbi:MAG: hypothetical protein E6Q76_19645 [Rhizobium sp.]|nr:MAG: hypothetical protein E6Q76_19645 [Rhizobium sp.]
MLYIGEDMTVTWSGASGTDGSDGSTEYLNAATVTYAIKTVAGASVSGGTGSLSYIAGSNGDYIGVIESTVTAGLTPGARYIIEYTLVEDPYRGFRRVAETAVLRGAS